MNRYAGAQKWLILFATSAIFSLFLLDETVFGPALPHMQAALGPSPIAIHWVINSYLLAFACFATLGGILREFYGLKAVLCVSGAVFLTGSLLGGLAQDAWLVVLARGFQGIGGGILFPVSMLVVASAFPKDRRGMALGTLASAGTTFLALGPILGGALTEYASWRWIFLLNVPVFLFGATVILVLANDKHEFPAQKHTDYMGFVLLLSGLSLLVFGLMEAPEQGLVRYLAIAAVIVGVTITALFFRHEARVREPLINVGLLSKPSMLAGCATVFTGQFCKLTVAIFAAFYFHKVLHFSAFYSGLATSVSVLLVPFSTAIGGRVTDIYGSRAPILAGLAGMAVTMTGVAVSTHFGLLYTTLVALFTFGIFMPLCYVPALQLVLTQTAPNLHGEVMGVQTAAKVIGGTFGVTVASFLLALTGQFAVVFLGAAALSLVVLGIALLLAHDAELAVFKS
ncbi:MFS transporter [Roseibium sp. RKSG952]|uniref:MFS transporter n=1 Tax=Roseibium sp. RKSG952 TaxID=2529384 RepID=UPI0012BBD4C7|nr:MFS transporter [Roseibium sp. RKSG952]MTH98383.1 MFS transporter [Roseibium sp. RKSG952]